RGLCRCAEHSGLVVCARRIEEAAHAALDRMHGHLGVDLFAARRTGERERGIEVETQRRLASEHVERVATRETVARPGDRRRADRAVLEDERDRRGVLDVAALARALRK